MDLVPFHVEHLERFEPGERERRLVESADEDVVERYWGGRAVSLLDGDRVLGIAGVGMDGDVARAGLLLSDDLRARPVLLHRIIRAGMADLWSGTEARRLEVSVHPADRTGLRWLERLGFTFDTALPNYAGSGETFWRYGLDRH